MKKFLQRAVIFVLFIAGLTSLHGQFNVLVGYNVGYSEAKGINQVLESYRNSTAWNIISFDDFHLSHGLALSGRYRFENISLGLEFRTKSKDLKSEGIPPGEIDAYKRKLSFRNNSWGFLMESNYESINWGISLDYNTFRIRTTTSDISDAYDIINAPYWSTHFYMSFEVYGTDFLGIALRPFVQIPFSKVSLDDLSVELDLSESKKVNLLTFGLSLLLVNGPRSWY